MRHLEFSVDYTARWRNRRTKFSVAATSATAPMSCDTKMQKPWTPTVSKSGQPIVETADIFQAFMPESPITAKTILIVDDESAVQRFVDRVLREAGYDTTLASDAAAALALWDTGGPFDLLLTDLMMPGMVGQELARAIEARTPSVKVVYLTAFTLSSFATAPVLSAREAYVEKPVTASALREAVSQLLFGHAQGPAPAPRE
jgi:CheY-like chemotaxis protein